MTAQRSRADVWFVLIITGGTSAILQMWHATHSAGTYLLIAALVGLVPAATAIGLSHVVASHKSAVLLRLLTVAVMVAVMAASANAAAAVVRPIDGLFFSWVLCIALDAAALASVWVLLGDSERKAAEVTALETAQATAREAADKATRLEAELAVATTALDAAPQAPARPRQRARQKAGQKRASDPDKTRATLARVLVDNPGWTNAEVARTTGVSERTVSRARNAPAQPDTAQDGRRLVSVPSGRIGT